MKRMASIAVLVIGLLASIVGLYSFLSGNQSLQEVAGEAYQDGPDASPSTVSASAPTAITMPSPTAGMVPLPTSEQPPIREIDGTSFFVVESTPAQTAPAKVTPEQPVMPTVGVVQVDSFAIPPKDSDGYLWRVPSAGRYEITYAGGAYSPWPDAVGCDPAGCWKTTVFIYGGDCEVEWIRKPGADLDEPGNFDWRIGEDPWQQTPELAEEIAGFSDGVTIDLPEGSCLRFVTIDGVSIASGYNVYTDNLDYEGGIAVVANRLGP